MTKRVGQTNRKDPRQRASELPLYFESMLKAVALRGGDPEIFGPELAASYASRPHDNAYYFTAAAEKLKDGQRLIETGHRLQAIHAFIDAIILNPVSVPAFTFLAQALDRSGFTHECIEMYSEALSQLFDFVTEPRSEYQNRVIKYLNAQIQRNTKVAEQLSSSKNSSKYQIKSGIIAHSSDNVFTNTEELLHSSDVKNEEKIQIPAGLKEIFDATAVPQERRGEITSKFYKLIDESRFPSDQDLPDKLNTRPSKTDTEKSARTITGLKSKAPNDAVAIARLQATLTELSKTDLTGATADDKEAVRVSQNLRRTANALKARGVTDLPPNALVPIRNANRILKARQRSGRASKLQT